MPRFALLIALSLFAAPAFAQDDAVVNNEDDDEFDFLLEGERNAANAAEKIDEDDFSMYDDEDELDGFQLKAEPQRAPAAVASNTSASTDGAPLSGNYEAQVVAVVGQSVVVELPVLISDGRSTGESWWLIGEVYVDGAKVGETRQYITDRGLTSGASTTAYLKMQAPVQASSGQVEVRVSKRTDGGTTPLFSSKTSYRL